MRISGLEGRSKHSILSYELHTALSCDDLGEKTQQLFMLIVINKTTKQQNFVAHITTLTHVIQLFLITTLLVQVGGSIVIIISILIIIIGPT